VALESNKLNSNLVRNRSFIKTRMSSHVGLVVIDGFPQEKEVIVEEFGGQPASSTVESNFSFEQGRPWCM
jgi:hypothetical protein